MLGAGAFAVALLALAVTVGPAVGKSPKPSTAKGMNVVLTPLIGTSSNHVQTVTFSDRIGLHLDVTNTGKSTANHLKITVASDRSTFSDASRPECGVDPQDAKKMVCILQQMKSGAPTFSADLRFTAPASGSSTTATPAVTVDAQTVGGPGNNGTQTTTGSPVTTLLVSSAGNSLIDSFLRPTEQAATAPTLPQHSKFTLPNSFLGGHYGIETSVQETTGTPLCPTCPNFVTVLSIPASLLANTPFSPSNAFSFTVTLLPWHAPSGYVPTGLYHDGTLIPMCSSSPLGPSTHICLNSFTPGPGNGIVATGVADQNGRVAFG